MRAHDGLPLNAIRFAQGRQPFLIGGPALLDAGTALLHSGILKLSHGIGLLDCLIAACAVERSMTLYSVNVKHYAAYLTPTQSHEEREHPPVCHLHHAPLPRSCRPGDNPTLHTIVPA